MVEKLLITEFDSRGVEMEGYYVNPLLSYCAS